MSACIRSNEEDWPCVPLAERGIPFIKPELLGVEELVLNRFLVAEAGISNVLIVTGTKILFRPFVT